MNALQQNKYVPLMLETYQEAKTTGEVSLKHWNVTDTEGFDKYSIYEYAFASDYSWKLLFRIFLRRKFDSLRYLDPNQEIVEYWQKKVAARGIVRYVEREDSAFFKVGIHFPLWGWV